MKRILQVACLFGVVALLSAAAMSCSSDGDGEACSEGTLRCSGNRIEVCTSVFEGGATTTEWTLLTDCAETEQECTTNAARCGGIGPCCAD